MKLFRSCTQAVALVCAAFTTSALASGGPVDEQVWRCESGGPIVETRIFQAYSSESRGSMRVFRAGSQSQQLLTSLADCRELCFATVDAQVSQAFGVNVDAICGAGSTASKALSEPAKVIVCGNSASTKQNEGKASETVRPNNNGYFAAIFLDGPAPRTRVLKFSGSGGAGTFTYGSDAPQETVKMANCRVVAR